MRVKSQPFFKRILIAITALAGVVILGAGHGLSVGGQAPQPQPHPPLTVEQRNARAAYWASKRGLQFGVPEDAYERALSNAKALSVAATGLPGGTFAWSAIGPQPMLNNYPNFAGFFTGPTLNTSEGRVAAVATDPITSNLVYVGAAGGGVWRSSDGGATFIPIFNNEPVQAIGAITVDRKGNVWVGTGEGVHSDSYYGQGIFLSSDHGDTWTQITGGAGNPFIHTSFRRIAVDSNTPPHIFAAATYAASLSRADAIFTQTNYNNDGLWRSTDGGATWLQVGNSTASGGRATFNGCTLGLKHGSLSGHRRSRRSQQQRPRLRRDRFRQRLHFQRRRLHVVRSATSRNQDRHHKRNRAG